MPVTSDGHIVGSVFESRLMSHVLKNPSAREHRVEEAMSAALPFIDINTGLDDLAGMVSEEHEAVLVKDFKRDKNFIITRADLAEIMVR